MSRIVWPSIAATCVALYIMSRKRKIDIELEIEPAAESHSDNDMSLADTALMAE